MAGQIIATCGQILDAVAQDAAISAYVAANFTGKSALSLHLGADLQNLPLESVLPAMFVFPTAFGRNDEYDHDEAVVSLGLAIKVEGKTPAANYTQLDGYQILVELAELVTKRVEIALGNNILQLSDVAIDTDYPFFKATWSFRVPESA